MKKSLHINITGIVQGVGFRPYIWRLAREFNLCGWVRNTGNGVEIMVEGADSSVLAFTAQIPLQKPSLSVIDKIVSSEIGEQNFSEFIINSTVTTNPKNDSSNKQAAIGADSAICKNCLQELIDPTSRRYRFPFITCTHCGPRYTLTRSLPYDRAQTSLANFPLCAVCELEYQNPADRRFHAETTCCEKCGPKLSLIDAQQNIIFGDEISNTLELILAGKIVAIKGLGGFHLVCKADNINAVENLRIRKNRDQKPFALMFANINSAKKYVEINLDEEKTLQSSAGPVVLVRKNNQNQLAGIAPDLEYLGIMLPYTPIQWLLFHEFVKRTSNINDLLTTPNDLVLVMTSANPSGEPLVIEDEEAVNRLQINSQIADAILFHNRNILIRCDDSVVRVEAEQKINDIANSTTIINLQYIRRARGFTPQAIKLPPEFENSPSVLAVGGFYKNTICITRGDNAFISQHIGGLDNLATCEFMNKTINHLSNILEVQPQIIACDLHPDFYSTKYAWEYSQKNNLPIIEVQHHLAHCAVVLAEQHQNQNEKILALSLDGVGLGNESICEKNKTNIWGGELFLITPDFKIKNRLGHLQELLMPGGESAAKEPWRMALGVLHQFGKNEFAKNYFAHQNGVAVVLQMLAKNINCPQTTSAGRLFDTVCGLLKVCENMDFEGQAPMILEGLAEKYFCQNHKAINIDDWKIIDNVVSLQPFFSRLINTLENEKNINQSFWASTFHQTLINALGQWLLTNAKRENIKTVVFGGGCFLNKILLNGLTQKLKIAGLKVLYPKQVPVNDGGLSLGQAYYTLQHINKKNIKFV